MKRTETQTDCCSKSGTKSETEVQDETTTFMNLSFLGAQRSRTRYSMVKKQTVKWSMTPMMARMKGSSTMPSSFSSSSSIVEMMKVTVETSTMEREKKAQNLMMMMQMMQM